MRHKNHWYDQIGRDRGAYRNRVEYDDSCNLVGTKQLVIDKDETEDALIEALDAGLTPEEIADIMLGSFG